METSRSKPKPPSKAPSERYHTPDEYPQPQSQNKSAEGRPDSQTQSPAERRPLPDAPSKSHSKKQSSQERRAKKAAKRRAELEKANDGLSDNDIDRQFSIRRILKSEMRSFADSRQQLNAFLVDWETGEDGQEFKPSWCKQTDIHKDALRDFQQKESSYRERVPDDEGKRKIVFDEFVPHWDGRRTKKRLRYLLYFGRGLEPLWVWADEFKDKDVKNNYKNRKGKWKRKHLSLDDL